MLLFASHLQHDGRFSSISISFHSFLCIFCCAPQDKILQSMGGGGGAPGKGVTVTNDGATILKSIHVDNPAAKIIVDVSMTQDAEVGDGTTSVAVLAGEFLRGAEELINQKIHPQTIIRGMFPVVHVAGLTFSCFSHDADAY